MSEDILPNSGESNTIKGMYEGYFLEYASYVILERAVPSIEDGLKPVQRRILHSMKEMDDGRFHKVANIIGQTMQFHPHGDSAIGEALVNLGQKNLLIDTQGNWGDIRTGDSAAAARYIEARLTKFALQVAFNPQTTEWQYSYDGRNKEPVNLPMKFPLVLCQGVEGIAVGLSTKVLPHNFIELIKASIKVLEGKRIKLYPDFATGGMMDCSQYNSGKRGGKVRVRAKIEQFDKSHLAVKELPFGVTTGQLIDSIIKANDKGKIKIKKVVDNTAKEVEVLIELASGISPELTIDALYAFTNCEVSISPNACIIIEDKPHFMEVEDILTLSTMRTKDLLRQELEIKKNELEEKWHFSSLEKIFIEYRIYRDIEECETWEEVLIAIETGLAKYVATPSDPSTGNDGRFTLLRNVTKEDLARLTEIKIKRISKYNKFRADEIIANIEKDLEEVKHHLAHLTEYAIAYFNELLDKYSSGRERRTVIMDFDDISAVEVVANNAKLYMNAKEGFIGHGIKKEEFISECSDIDDIIAFKKDGTFKVVRIADKVFVGKNIIHVGVWKKGDDRTTYHLIYLDGATGRTMVKRFNITAITRDKDYNLTKGTKGSKVLYFAAHSNGEGEIVNVQLSPGCKAKKKVFDYDLTELAIKGRGSQGNILTKYPVKKISQVAIGKSTLGKIEAWMDNASGRINQDNRGIYLGGFDTGDKIIALYKNGSYELKDFDTSTKFDAEKVRFIQKFNIEDIFSVVYYDAEKKWTIVKRFAIETTSLDQAFQFISEYRGSELIYATNLSSVELEYHYKDKSGKQVNTVKLDEFIDVKGWKALGNRLIEKKVVKVIEISKSKVDPDVERPLTAGDSIIFDLDENGQGKINFDD